MDGRYYEICVSAQSRAHRARAGLSFQSKSRRGASFENRNVPHRNDPVGRSVVKLAELSSLIRSKNAGPFVLTFDIMFPDDERYQRVKRAAVLSPRKFAELFHFPE